jgi:DNA (cytosine-5)-methyltransferase 1
MVNKVLNVIDLFCGAGGLSLGAARAGFTIRGAIDTDPWANATHQKNFPHTSHLSISVSDLSDSSLRHPFNLKNRDIDGIIGGPPCQGFSNIGHGNENDERNGLFIDFFRIVNATRPKFFLAENVPGILKEKYAAIRTQALNYVSNTYVVLDPLILTASDYGAPTLRKRVFFFGYLRNEVEKLTASHFKPPKDVETINVKDAFEGLPKKIKPSWQREDQGWRIVHARNDGFFRTRLHGVIPDHVGDRIAIDRLRNESRASGFLGTVHSREVANRYANVRCGQSDPISKSTRLELNGFCPTLRAGTGSDKGSYQAVRPLHPTENRVITPREAARLQGFPDWFQFSPTKWHSFRQIGSSVSPILAERILSVIHSAL